LVNYEHQAVTTPFRASHAVYVRPAANKAKLSVDEVPEMLRSRILSLRAFDGAGMMITADLADGKVLARPIKEMFDNPAVAYIHLHFAKPGCYAARVDRA
jgi:hypothetical protein